VWGIVHGGILWLDRPVSIDIELIENIAGISIDAEKPAQYTYVKTKDKFLA
jgi:hypothetical protein